MDNRDIAKELVKIARELTAKTIKKGLKFGDWTVTQYEPLVFDDYGSASDGIIKLVNQDTMDSFTVQHDHNLRNAKWWVSVNRRTIQDNNPTKVIEQAIKVLDKKTASVKNAVYQDPKGRLELDKQIGKTSVELVDLNKIIRKIWNDEDPSVMRTLDKLCQDAIENMDELSEWWETYKDNF